MVLVARGDFGAAMRDIAVKGYRLYLKPTAMVRP